MKYLQEYGEFVTAMKKVDVANKEIMASPPGDPDKGIKMAIYNKTKDDLGKLVVELMIAHKVEITLL